VSRLWGYLLIVDFASKNKIINNSMVKAKKIIASACCLKESLMQTYSPTLWE
jgi:hypothetical protein